MTCSKKPRASLPTSPTHSADTAAGSAGSWRRQRNTSGTVACERRSKRHERWTRTSTRTTPFEPKPATRSTPPRRLLGEIDRARLKAVADRDQALAGLREGDLEGARTCAQDVLDNEQADADARADAERVLAVLPEFDAGKALMDDEDFPGAMEAFESILRPREVALWPPARVAAERLRDIAGQSRKNKLVDSIHRAPGASGTAGRGRCGGWCRLAGREPAGVRAGLGATTLTDFETFLQDCAVISKPARPGKTLSPGDRLGEKYEVLEFLGRGGMGEVYRARDLSLDREVALKLAAPAAESGPLAEALRNEAKAIAALTHPHIIHINSFDVIDDRPCFDTNYIRGRDLDQYASQHVALLAGDGRDPHPDRRGAGVRPQTGCAASAT